jgi:DNA-binding NtrC family response regulator
VAPSDATVLIRGESGTGKELVAHAIHSNSGRAGKPYVAVNCAAIPETLIESELFGHEKGAFTGATAAKKGQVEVADGGTLFLDEIGDLPLQAQAALLRFLENKTFQHVGGTRPLQVDVRVVAATNRNLEDRIQQGLFREDLYFRLQVIELHMPSLAERREDIPMLAAHFLKQFRHTRVVSGFSSQTRRLFTSYDWPGNIRELRNAIERALLLGTSEMIQPEDLPESLTETLEPDDPSKNSLNSRVNAFKRAIFVETLQKTGGNVPEAARLLEISPSYLSRSIRSFKIQSP